LVLVGYIATILATGRWIDIEREFLIVVDLLLVVVFGLLLYSISARDPLEGPAMFDWLNLVLVVAALVVDVLALWAIGARISDCAVRQIRPAARGMSEVVIVTLAGAAALYAGWLRGGVPVGRLWT